MQSLTTMFKQFIRDEEGVTAIEYGLIAALIAVFLIVSLKILGTSLDAIFQHIGTELDTARGA